MIKIGVLTSGGDAPGMNAAVRAVVRTAIHHGAQPFAIFEGYQGMIAGGDRIRPFGWNDVSGILHRGGTIIGSARCAEFMTTEGREKAAFNLLQHGINRLVVCGGDGSLTGADIFRQEWPQLLERLVASGQIKQSLAEQHAQLTIAGLPGSIDNDLCGTDITIGADTALHRITSAVDAISSTAASHQRTFVVEVMGRKCGYLAMMSAIASGADWALIPESPPNVDDWRVKMCDMLDVGRQMGRRDNIVIVAEGACDRTGKPIHSADVKQTLEERLGEDTRVTILGHVQRGGAPSAFDRNLSTLTGARAIETLLNETLQGTAHLVGIKGNKISLTPLHEALAQTHAVADAVAKQQFEQAMELRGSSFKQAWGILRTLVRAQPRLPQPNQKRLRIAILNAGAPAPGMNNAVRSTARLSMDRGHEVLGVYDGFRGLIEDDIHEFDWMSVNGWAASGGSELGTNRTIPTSRDFYAIARNLEKHKIEALLVIGGYAGYKAALKLYDNRKDFASFQIPIVCMPTTIDNDLPGSELSIGTDTALNNIVDVVDKIKSSAVAANRAFIVEVMGRTCGYLALMSALATGAERVYLPEEGVTLQELQTDVNQLIDGFAQGKRLGLIIRNEATSETYDTNFMTRLFEEEGGDSFDVRSAILGHLQQGGDPSPFDRIQGSSLAMRCIEHLEKQMGKKKPSYACVGLVRSKVRFTKFSEMAEMMDDEFDRPVEQWWLSLRPIARILAQPALNGDDGD